MAEQVANRREIANEEDHAFQGQGVQVKGRGDVDLSVCIFCHVHGGSKNQDHEICKEKLDKCSCLKCNSAKLKGKSESGDISSVKIDVPVNRDTKLEGKPILKQGELLTLISSSVLINS